MVGIVGCGAIANLITGFVRDGRVPVKLGFFYDRDLERAENLASMVDGRAVLDVADMLPEVDLVVEAGTVLVNKQPTFRVDHMPFGGFKCSGMGKEGVKYAIRDMTRTKLIVLNGN